MCSEEEAQDVQAVPSQSHAVHRCGSSVQIQGLGIRWLRVSGFDFKFQGRAKYVGFWRNHGVLSHKIKKQKTCAEKMGRILVTRVP